MSALIADIYQALTKIPLIDCHEHILEYASAKNETLGALETISRSYAALDFIAAGMEPDIWKSEDRELVWKYFTRYQPYVRNTNFYKCVIRTLKDLFGLESTQLDRQQEKQITQKIQAAYARNDWYEEVLKKRCNIAVSILDNYWSIEEFKHDPDFFVPSLRVDPFILGRKYNSPWVAAQNSHSTVEGIASAWSMGLDTFEAYLELIESAFSRYLAKGCPAIKICVAYERDMYFSPCSQGKAKGLYDKSSESLTAAERIELGNFMAHHIIQLAIESELPVQIHTGFLARNAIYADYGNPEKLNNLFIAYPKAKFVLFHNGFPYTHSTFSLIKMFPNVYLDICWASNLSCHLAEESLFLALDMIPSNKIMWGGDAERVEDAYASTVMSLEVISKVLGKKVKKGMHIDHALSIAKNILHDNALDFYPRLAASSSKSH